MRNLSVGWLDNKNEISNLYAKLQSQPDQVKKVEETKVISDFGYSVMEYAICSVCRQNVNKQSYAKHLKTHTLRIQATLQASTSDD